MDISIIIVSWNVKEKLEKNLEALLASQGVNFEILVVDNGSQDNSQEMIREKFPQVKLLVNSENLGFAKACNQALKIASGRYFLLLNPDMKVFPNTLSRAVLWLNSNTQAAIAGIKLLNEAKKPLAQVRRFPRLFDQFLIASKLAHLFPWSLNSYLQKDFNYNQASQVDSIRGSFFVIRRSTVEKIGLLDERYFVWFEEVDYCRQAKSRGLEVWYTPEAEAIDFVGQSFKQLPIVITQKYFKESMLKYFAKWHSAWQLVVLKVAWLIGAVAVKIFK